ncbi:sugar transporter domain-containing protein [Phthorimaea operculella]|nr:sugar transporter domain-containing protein [Phthorimaea operculella]
MIATEQGYLKLLLFGSDNILQYLSLNLGALAAGVCVAWSSSALPLVSPGHNEFSDDSHEQNASDYRYNRLQMTQSEASWVACLLCLGAVFGAIPAGLISQFFGRKKTLVYLALPLVVSWIMVASSVSIPPYIEDIAEKPLLSTLANFYHLHFSCGVLFGYIIGMVNIFWHCLLCSSIPVAFFIAFIFLPESPAYLISQGKSAEAKASLRYFRGIDNDIDAEMKEIKENIRYNLRNKVTFKQLFSRRVTVKALVVSFGLMIFQQFAVYILFFLLTPFLSLSICL